MSSKSYHHGDLRTAMIEKGIKLINENGAKTISLRKVAAACGVSHAAPYSHFANKEDLFTAIKDHITVQFSDALRESVKETKETPEGLVRLGCAYAMFFVRNPEYFRFIFSHSGISAGEDRPYEPYDFYVAFMQKLLDKMDYPQELRLKAKIAQWAMFHGLTAVVLMLRGNEGFDWEEIVADILSNNYLLIK